MLDRHTGLAAQPLDEVTSQPAGPLGAERRDDDLVDAFLAHRLERRGERIGMRDLPVRVDPGPPQLGDGALQPALRLGMTALRGVALG